MTKEFEMPDISERLSNLSPSRRKLLLQRLNKEAKRHVGQSQDAGPIPKISRDEHPALSFAQQRLWFLDQLAPGNPFYNIVAAVRCKGSLDTGALEKSLNEIVRRHEALRTTFPSVDGKAVQAISPSLVLHLPIASVAELSESEREQEAQRLASEEAMWPFDLAAGPLVRASLLKINEREHVLLLNMHHIISDGWSMGVFIREIVALYKPFSEEKSSPLPELQIQYADFAHWQREWLQREALDEQLSYWKRQLADLPALELPADRQRPDIECFQGKQHALHLSKPLTESLKALSLREETTLFMTLLAAFKTLLYRYTEQSDIAVGTAIANRNRAEIENLIGFFVNSLVMRTDMSGNPSFRELMARVREVSLEAYAHQDLPFEKLVEELHPERNTSFNPLFQVMFALQNTPMPEFKLPGLTLSYQSIENYSAKFDIVFDMWESADGLEGMLEYNTDIFEPSTIERLAEHYRTLLDAVVADPDQAISDLSILSPRERNQLLVEWNDTQSAYPDSESVHRLFEFQAERYPKSIAVSYDGRELTYSELNRQANQLAHHLKTLGVGPNVIVGVYLDRSPEMVITFLGILKAGGAYLPLDSSYPKSRIAFMIEDARVRVLLTRQRMVDELPQQTAIPICVDSDWDVIATHSQQNLSSSVSADNLAYVIYTSGSTGKPKGVCVIHKAINRLVLNTDYVDLAPSDVIAQASNSSFDAATFEIWGALLNGARLVGISRDVTLSPQDFAAQIKEEKITTLFLTTALFNQMVREVDSPFSTLRHILFGGEAVDPRCVKQVLDHSPPARLLHVYGPTENTTYSTWHLVDDVPEAATTVPIGKPISNSQTYVLDSRLQPVPVGVPGELFTGGDGLSRGYLNRPDLSAEKFIPHPYSEKAGERLYRTGDKARLLEDGSIEFLGRFDNQVKVRGFRIELGEIEAELENHPAVTEAIVVAREDLPGDRRLVAYVVQNQDYDGELKQETATDLQAEQVSQWGMVFDDIYSQDSPTADPTFNIIGWKSSYTGEQIPPGEMAEWLDDTVERILSLHPASVLEIGCGTGLILFQVAQHCARYRGVDVSELALDYLRRQLSEPQRSLPQVELFRRAADDFEGIGAGEFDGVILNSVIQYFPSIDYLARVLEGAVNCVSPGGFIFVGDVRSLPLLRAFHCSVELSKAESSLPIEELRQRAQMKMMQDDELVIDPDFFIALKHRLPAISHVEVLPKRGRAHNELTQFRYQVVIHVGELHAAAPNISWLDYERDALSVTAVERLLKDNQLDAFGIKGVPNARLSEPVAIAEMLAGEETGTAEEIRNRVKSFASAGVDPQHLWTLAEELGYQANINWARPGIEGRFDVAFLRDRLADSMRLDTIFWPSIQDHSLAPLNRYANNPMHGVFARKAVPELKRHLHEKLPDYMVPATFVMLEAMPLTPNGKVDRRALPAPEQVRPELEEAFVAPRTSTEEALANIWTRILSIERIGVHDDFFELGGHSLLATQVISRIRGEFSLDLPLRRLFELPTIAQLAQVIDVERRGGKVFQAPDIERVPRDQRLALSFAQQRLWFLNQLEPGHPFYNVPAAIRMRGRLDKAAFDRTLNEIVRRHEALRTTFAEFDGQPAQVITPVSATGEPLISASVLDLESLPEAQRETQALRLANEEARLPFDLIRGPVLRVTLLRLSETDHVLLVTLHHIAADGWSIGVFIREMAALYEAFCNGKDSPLAELDFQYADFAQWQSQWLRGEVLEAQSSYWKRQLGGNIPVLQLPTDRPRPAIQTFRGAEEDVELSSSLVASLEDLARQEGATLFMALLSALDTLLYRYSGQEEILIGSPIANRNREEIEGLIGFFVNTLVMKTDLSGALSFRELLGRVREVTLGAYANQDVPFEKLVEVLQPDRDLSRQPLFQVMFVLQNMPMQAIELSNLTLSPQKTDNFTSKFDLTLSLSPESGGLTGWWEYNTDLFDASTIHRMNEQYIELLEAIVKNPDARISQIALLTDAERDQLLVTWNDTKADYPTNQSVQDLFEAQVARTPDIAAASFGQASLSYRELNARANQLAHYLRKMGVGPDVPVGICIERSLEMVVGVLGILKAGGAYVPLDPSYPKERVTFMLENAGAPVLVTKLKMIDRLPDWDKRAVYMDSEWTTIAQESQENPASLTLAENLCYVIHTSGSTGKPKGVAMCHHALTNMIFWQLENFDATVGLKTLQFASLSFDVSFQEMFSTWCSGGELLLIPEEARLDAAQLIELLKAEDVGRLFLPFVALQQLAEVAESQGATLSNLREIITAGEQLQISRPVASFFERLTNCALHNHYGPSESHAVTAYKLTGSPSTWGALPPVGRPIANTQIYLLDAEFQPVPIGIAGELYIGGDALARGYINRPEMTAERFTPDPFSQRPGARLYKTGDLARYLSDGNIEFLGRNDQQVKIRGYRVELGEIEAVLSHCPGVRNAVVFMRDMEGGDKRLVAYLTVNLEQPPAISDLKNYLKKSLPDYMAPSSFVMLEEFPLTPSGKVDRRALPAPDHTGAGLDERFIAPRTPVEELLAGIWMDVLRAEQVGINDSFFELGGHSLLATQVISRVRSTFQIEMPLRALFETPTVAGLAETISAAISAGESLQAPPVVSTSREGDLALSFAQQRLWFLDQLEPHSTAYILPVFMSLKGPLDIAALEKTFSEIVRRHEILRTTFPAVDGRPSQVISPPQPVTLPVLDLRVLPRQEREDAADRLATEEMRRGFNLAQGPLIRFSLTQVDEQDFLLLMNMHHIISDGWSLGILFREIEILYAVFAAGKPSQMPDLPVQYADYARWQRQWLQGDVLEGQLDYWKQQLSDLHTLELPADRPRPPVQEFHGATHEQVLSETTTAGIKQLARKEDATLFMILLAAFKVLMHRHTGQNDIAAGSPIAGRNQVAIEGLIGFFVNTLVMRTDMSGNPSFREVVRRVRETALGAYAHQDLPFEKLVEELQPERDLSRHPFFPVFFNMLNLEDVALELPGVSVEMRELPEYPSKFDMTLYAGEREGRLIVNLIYNADLFDHSRMVELIGQFDELLSQALDDPDQGIEEFSLLTREARSILPDPLEQLESIWAGSIPARLSEHARRAPDHKAVSDKHEAISYQQLDCQSNQLASYLRENNIQPADVVAIYGHRSASLVRALLGVMKSGAAFLILDPDYPAARLIECIRIANPRGFIQLESASMPSALDDYLKSLALRCRIEISQDALSDYSADPLDTAIEPDHLAYIAFTSGSTGTPKGIQGTHRPLSHFLEWHSRTFNLKQTDRFSMLSGLSHDPLLRDIFAPLWSGATLCIPDPDFIGSADRLRDWMRQEEISVAHLTPSLSHILTRAVPAISNDKNIALPSLRYGFFGGEVLTWQDVNSLEAIAPSITCVNFYGATETPQAIAYFITPRPSSISNARVPIGYGIEDVQLLVLNSSSHLAGIGELGEIHIRTPYLAKGYVGDKHLTEEKFITNTFTGEKNDRLYRTGDLGRYLPDGSLEIVGRIDDQIKIRGYRIEPGEVEAALKQHPDITEAVVLAGEDGRGDRRLVGYIVARDQQAPSVAELRRHLKSRLPEYMLPSFFVSLDQLPLTPNGKVNRKALPALDYAKPALEADFTAPRTVTEEMVCGIWCEVLSIDQISIHDNFFHLGGHSLIATQAISRARDAFRIEVPLRRIFESPTVAGLAEAIDAARQTETLPQAPDITRVARDERMPLSYAQERLWFLDQLEPNSPAYIIPAALRISGLLDLPALLSTFNQIVARHESLRTSFSIIDSRPVQLISPSRNHLLDFTDLSHLDHFERERRASSIATDEAHRPFDLSRDHLLRTKLLKLADLDHVLILTMHHIISDGWSISVFIREIAAIYSALVNGQQPRLDALEIQYADYAAWQRQWLEGQQMDSQLKYWRQQLGSEIRSLELPTDKVRPARASYRGGREYAKVSPEVSRKLREMSRRESVTVYMLVMAAYKVMLMRVSGQEDVRVGTPIAGRNRSEVEGLIGFFVNTLVMRTDLSGNPSFRDLLKRVREVTLEAYTNEDFPFEKLVDELQPERDLSRQPLFQVMFVLQDVSREGSKLPGLTFDPIVIENETAKFDLTLSMVDTGSELTAMMGYKTDLFDPSTVNRMMRQFLTLLENAIANPDERISDLQIMSEAERRQMLVEWNDTEAEYASGFCIHELFEQQVERTPDADAIIFGEEQLTYRELNRRANQLAHHLALVGVGPEVRVGIYLERSTQMITGLLATLKAGGVYVPLDPAYPQERISFMTGDSGAQVLLTQKRFLGTLSKNLPKVICLDDESSNISNQSEHNLDSKVSNNNLAYIIYTSGSTGMPKGVMIEHQGICNLAAAQIHAFQIEAGSRVLQFAPFSFDASVSEIFTSLLEGATIVLGKYESMLPGSGLIDLLRDERITTVTFPPTVLSSLPDALLPSMKTIVSAGEACSAEIIQRWGANNRFLNAYGPTEVTVCATIAECNVKTGNPTIGKPIPNAQVYLLDKYLQPVPIGVTGQMHVGGHGLARGYIGQPALTAEKFIPNPFSLTEGSRLYSTGDLARYKPDGEIEFLGRIDEQVKVRGHRIEVGEIEAALISHPQVREAVVIAREEDKGEKRLVAYVVASEQVRASVSELREYLKERVPEALVPSAIVVLDELPKTVSGKIDRKALPALDRSRPDLRESYTEPRTELEIYIAEMWQEILGIDKVGVHDDFFELGGDSIRGAIFINKLQERLGQQVYVVILFDAPNIADLTGYLNRHYPEAVARITGRSAPVEAPVPSERIDDVKLIQIRELIPSLAPFNGKPEAAKNPSAIFILSPPRSGSTLMRVMLAGHRQLFAPPELELLGFNTLGERKAAFSARYGFWLEGTIRAIMQIKGYDADRANKIMQECESQDMSVKQFYRLMQEWAQGRTLVDKTPSYALDIGVLNRAEEYFDNAIYIHLLRHPYGMIRSFEEAKLEQVFFRYQHNFSNRELAELIWVISQQNIVSFLEAIPRERKYNVRFEELVKRPSKVLEAICGFLGLEFQPEMIQPYLEKQNRMTDGIHPLSKMLGDVKFHEHAEIDSSVAERWREHYREDFLSETTWQMAESLGYEKDSEARTVSTDISEQPARALKPIQRLPWRGRVTAD